MSETDWRILMRGLTELRAPENIFAEVEDSGFATTTQSMTLFAENGGKCSAIVFPARTGLTSVFVARNGATEVCACALSEAEKLCAEANYKKNKTGTKAEFRVVESFADCGEVSGFPVDSRVICASVHDMSAFSSGIVAAMAKIPAKAVFPGKLTVYCRGFDLNLRHNNGFNFGVVEGAYPGGAAGDASLVWPSRVPAGVMKKASYVTKELCLGTLDFESKKLKHEKTFELAVEEAGRLHGFVFWVDVDYGTGTLFSTMPGPFADNFGTLFVKFVENCPLTLMPGNKMTVKTVLEPENIGLAVSGLAPVEEKKVGIMPTIEAWPIENTFDNVRLQCYSEAISRHFDTVPDGKTENVLCTSAGLGLVPLMVASNYEAKVFAYEPGVRTEKICESVISANRSYLRGQVAATDSIEHLPKMVDCCVLEGFDSTLFGDGIIPMVRKLYENEVVGARTVMVPFAAAIYGCLAEFPEYDEMFGVDLSETTQLRRIFSDMGSDLNLNRSSAYKRLTSVARLQAINFQKRSEVCGEAPVTQFVITAQRSGKLNAIVHWNHLHFDSEMDLNTLTTSSWTPQVQFLCEPLTVEKGDRIEMYSWLVNDTKPLFAVRRVRDGPDAEPTGPAGGPLSESVAEWAKKLLEENGKVVERIQTTNLTPGMPVDEASAKALANVVAHPLAMGVDGLLAQNALEKSLVVTSYQTRK